MVTQVSEEQLEEEDRVLKEATKLLEQLHATTSPDPSKLDTLHQEVRHLQAAAWALRQEVRVDPKSTTNSKP
jgi:hypothetical protein